MKVHSTSNNGSNLLLAVRNIVFLLILLELPLVMPVTLLFDRNVTLATVLIRRAPSSTLWWLLRRPPSTAFIVTVGISAVAAIRSLAIARW
jgi:hypothetical protein